MSTQEELMEGLKMEIAELKKERVEFWDLLANTSDLKEQEDYSTRIYAIDLRIAASQQLIAAYYVASTVPVAAPPNQATTLQMTEVTIVIPGVLYGDDATILIVKFNDDEDLQNYLRVSGTVGLVEVVNGEPGKILFRKVSQLVPNGLYTHGGTSKKAIAWALRENGYLQHSSEQQAAMAMLCHVSFEEPHEQYELKEDVSFQLLKEKKICAEDFVILGLTKAYLGRHITFADSAWCVKDVANRAAELERHVQLRPVVKPAIIIERVESKCEHLFRNACKNRHVLRFQRSGDAVKLVNSMGTANRKQLLRF